MTPEKQQELNQHIQAIAKILQAEAEPENLENLGGIEKTIRAQTLEHITPQLGFFFDRNNWNRCGENQKDKKYNWRTTDQ